jgi:hypothetical protein
VRSRPAPVLLALGVLVLSGPAAGEDFLRGSRDDRELHWVRAWNRIAIDTSGLDHTPPALGETREFGEQLGPGRASRAMAIVHVAMFEALNAIEGGYESYLGVPRVRGDASPKAAVSLAAHDTLVALYPAQRQALDGKLAEKLRRLPRGREIASGVELGRRVAAAILALRANDGSAHEEPVVGVDFPLSDAPGAWRPDPISGLQLALGARWSEVEPFVMEAAEQFRAPPPPALDSPEFARAFDEAKRFGGDGVVTPTERTDEQTFVGIYWAYDGTPSLCAPPRLYNQIAVTIAELRRSSALQTARLLALVNLAMADTGLAIWESKYFYRLGRPVTVIRETDPAAGGDPGWSPLGAPASNLVVVNFTPPFPAYPSGHAGFGGALFEMLRNVYGTDAIPFTFVSDEWNGVTLDNQGNPRPLVPRSFRSLSQAEEENGQSRIWLGIHWAFDKTEGIAQGRRVADYVFANTYRPLRRR